MTLAPLNREAIDRAILRDWPRLDTADIAADGGWPQSVVANRLAALRDLWQARTIPFPSAPGAVIRMSPFGEADFRRALSDERSAP